MPTVLPPARTELSAPYPNPTNAIARTGMGKFYDYVTNLLGTLGTAVDARAALGVAESQLANYFVNGGCQVAQIAAVNLSTTAQYGAVDNVMAWASTGAVSAGTISQNTASGIGITGNSFKLAGVTLTGSAVLSVRIRIESKDAVKLKNIASSVAALVSHDVGAPVNYTVIVRKPTAADNYTSTTVISTSSAISVPTGISSATWLKSENIAMGDCSNGIEVEFKIACGAITTKNFEFTEFQVARGATAVAIPLKEYGEELRRCQRFGWPMRRAQGLVGNVATQVWRIGAPCPVKMRGIPTMALSGGMVVQAGAVAAVNLTAITSNTSTADAAEFDGTISTTTAPSGSPAIITADNANYIYVDSRL
jgi:hypothetical protein